MAEKIFQGGYMSGDTYAASAYLAVEPTARIILVKDTKEPQDKTQSVTMKFYTECGLAARVHLIDISGATIKVKEVWEAVKEQYKLDAKAPTEVKFIGNPTTLPQLLSRLYYGITPANSWPRSITAVTGLLGEKFAGDARGSATKVANLWKIGKFDTDMKFALYEYAGTRFAKTGFDIRDNIVVLWSRQSGKKGGAHVELDSSYAGIRQLVNYFAESKATVVLAGDERNGKLAAIAAEYGQVVDVAEMWKDPFWTRHFAGVPVLAQLAFFKFLAEDYRVIHVGMRSGILETMALLGMPTFYMEPAPSPSGERMLAFSRSGIQYSRIQIKEPAGLTARAAQQTISSGAAAAPSLAYFNRQVDRNAAEVKKEPAFQKAYGRWNRRFENYSFDDHARSSARDYGKVAVLGETAVLGDLSEGYVKTDTRKLRGFLNSDLDKITTAVEGAFKR